MRVPSWMATISAAICLCIAASGARAQTGGPGVVPANGGDGPFTATGPDFAEGPSFVGRGGWQIGEADHHQHDAILPAGGPAMPPGTDPWPRISPFEHGREQHQVLDGLWYRDVERGGRRYFARAKATLMTVRSPKQQIVLIGNPNIATAGNVDENADFTTLDTRVFEDDAAPLGDQFYNGIVNQHRDQIEGTPGMRVSFGWIEPADTAIEFNGWFTPTDRASYKRGQGNPQGTIDPDQPIWHSIALDTGQASVVGFDQLYRVEFESTYAGGGVNFFSNDVWPSEEYGLRMMWGARYMYIFEEFNFLGFDSGDEVLLGQPFTQRLASSTTSNLAGPQLGADYFVGGEGFRIRGQSTLGLLINVTDYDLGGTGLGDPDLPGYDPLHPFRTFDKHTHATPVYEQSLGVDMDILGLVPLLNRVSYLDSARVHLGYRLIFLWEVARPTNVIEWKGQPRDPSFLPHLADKRGQWYTHGWEVGLTCGW